MMNSRTIARQNALRHRLYAQAMAEAFPTYHATGFVAGHVIPSYIEMVDIDDLALAGEMDDATEARFHVDNMMTSL
jgi:hypothetical protein